MSRYSDVVSPDGELIHLREKYATFYSRSDFPDKYIRFTKWECVSNFCSECPGVFVADAKIDCEDYVILLFIRFYHYKNISSCYSHKQTFTDHGKTCPLWMNIENPDKGNVTTHRSLLLKSCRILDFHLEY